MGMKLVEEGLRSLCLQYGWAYGVHWKRAIAGDSTGLLTVEATYHEEQHGKVVDDMLQQVESVQEGINRAAALCRTHYWLFSDSYQRNEKSNELKDADLWKHQFLYGIKTIAIIPLQTQGLVVFGSCRKIFESMKFINHVNRTLEVPQICPDSSVLAATQKIQNSEGHNPFDVSAPTCKSENSLSRYDNISQQATCGSGAELMSLFETHRFANFDDLIQNYQSPTLIDDFMGSFDPHSQQDLAKGSLSTSFSSVTNHQQSNLPSNDFSAIERHIWEMIEMQQMPSSSQQNILGCGESSVASYHGENAPLEAVVGRGRLESSKMGFCETEGFLGNSRSSPLCPKSGGILSSCNQQSELNSFVPQHSSESISMLTFHEDLASQSTSVSRPFQMNFTSVIDGSRGTNSISSGFSGIGGFGSNRLNEMPVRPTANPGNCPLSSLSSCPEQKESCLDTSAGVFSDTELFDCVELDLKDCNQAHRSWDDIIIPEESANCSSLTAGILGSVPEFLGATGGHSKELLSDIGLRQQVEALSVGNTNFTSYTDISTVNSVFNSNADNLGSFMSNTGKMTPCRTEVMSSGFPCISGKESLLLPGCDFEKLLQVPPNNVHLKSQLSSWIDDCNSMNVESAVTTQPKKSEDPAKMARKRARPGESTRPRPKDRQLIQDRVKELREIVPNSTKCSIDALLDRTIKHMLYLQSVTKYADKLKQADEPKMIGEESGVVLRDNSSAGGGGATWAFEVAGQTMVCPIIVEDLSPPGQMLIEMLCEERGLFLEIADVIRGFGLTILKGVMEVRDSKIWSRFLVEASGNVTRMEIFLSLVQLLQQTNSSINLSACQPTKELNDGIAALGGYRQAHLPFPVSLGSDPQ